jgi:hypothetical protein
MREPGFAVARHSCLFPDEERRSLVPTLLSPWRGFRLSYTATANFRSQCVRADRAACRHVTYLAGVLGMWPADRRNRRKKTLIIGKAGYDRRSLNVITSAALDQGISKQVFRARRKLLLSPSAPTAPSATANLRWDDTGLRRSPRRPQTAHRPPGQLDGRSRARVAAGVVAHFARHAMQLSIS